MDRRTRRWILYPAAVVVTSALCFFGFFRRAEADFLTLISAANMHAEMAARIPADSDDPTAREFRQRLLREAFEWLERAEAVEPATSVACQIRGYIAAAEGRPREAAQLYAQARRLPDCPVSIRDELVFNEARAYARARDYEAAVATLQSQDDVLGDDNRAFGWALRARFLQRAGRTDDAHELARRVGTIAAVGDKGCLVAAEILEELEDFEGAEAAYRRSRQPDGIRDYYLARLKVRAGEIDSALALLKRSIEGAGTDVRDLLGRDREVWSSCAEDERFTGLMTPGGEAAVPVSGR